jgi:hypothetical protein
MAMLAACSCLWSCGDPQLECGAEAVKGTVASMVRGRFLRVAGDAYPSSYDASKRAGLSKATRVTALDPRLLEWDATTGRLTCMARLVIEAPGPETDTNLRREAALRYRVTRDDDDTYFVEVAYAELMALFPARPSPGSKPESAP